MARMHGSEIRQQEKISSLGVPYLLYLPPSLTKEKQTPLMLFLHGSGERGNDLNKVKSYGPPKLVETRTDLPFIIVSPQCPEGEYWNMDLLEALLQEVTQQTNADQDKIYITGVSMGGYATWELALRCPERYAAIVPICGGGDPALVYTLAKVPVWVFHGAKDLIVPMEASQVMVEALNEVNGNVQFTIYPDAGHNSWTKTYNNMNLYDWLYAQKRQSPS